MSNGRGFGISVFRCFGASVLRCLGGAVLQKLCKQKAGQPATVQHLSWPFLLSTLRFSCRMTV